MYSATVEQVSLQDPGFGMRGSDKYYAAYVIVDPHSTDDARVMFRWGRRGSKGQTQVQVCRNLLEAERIAHNKIVDKQAKGYGNNLPTDGVREIDAVPSDLLEMAGIDSRRSPTPTSVDRKAVFADFAGTVDRAIRMSMGTPDEQNQAVQIRSTLKEQLTFLREQTLRSEGAFELLDEVLYQRMEASI